MARLATVSAAGVPHLVPVTFAVHGDTGGVRGGPQTEVDAVACGGWRNIEENPAVCFLTDGYDEDWSRLWWARADGSARVLPDAERAEPMSWLLAKYGQYRERPPEHAVVSTEIHTWRGWAGS